MDGLPLGLGGRAAPSSSLQVGMPVGPTAGAMPQALASLSVTKMETATSVAVMTGNAVPSLMVGASVPRRRSRRRERAEASTGGKLAAPKRAWHHRDGMIALETPYFLVEVDGSGLIVRAQRSSREYPDVVTLESDMLCVGAALDQLGRDRRKLLVDLRDGPRRNDPAFEETMRRVRPRIFRGFRGAAILVSTAVGALQVKRHMREDGVGAEVFHDEGEALEYLRGQSVRGDAPSSVLGTRRTTQTGDREGERASWLPERTSSLPERSSQLPERTSSLPERSSQLPERTSSLPSDSSRERRSRPLVGSLRPNPPESIDPPTMPSRGSELPPPPRKT